MEALIIIANAIALVAKGIFLSFISYWWNVCTFYIRCLFDLFSINYI